MRGAEDLVRRSKLKNLQAKFQRKFGKFDPSKEATDAISPDTTSEALSQARDLTTSGGNIPATLEGHEVDDINPLDFFKTSKGFDAGGELTRGKVGNPFSITSPENKEALEGVNELKIFGSRAEQTASMRLGDQLQPMRDIMGPQGRADIKPSQIKSYSQVKAEVKAKMKVPEVDTQLKASLPDVDALQKQTEARASQIQTQVANEVKPKVSPDIDPEKDADVIAPTDDVAKDVAETGVKDAVKSVAKKATGDAVEGVLATGEEIADTGAGSELGLNPLADATAIGLGLASVLGGLFGKKKDEAPPTPPPPRPAINPSVALGI